MKIRTIAAIAILLLGSVAAQSQPNTDAKPKHKHHVSKRTWVIIGAAAAGTAAAVLSQQGGHRQEFRFRGHFPKPIRASR